MTVIEVALLHFCVVYDCILSERNVTKDEGELPE